MAEARQRKITGGHAREQGVSGDGVLEGHEIVPEPLGPGGVGSDGDLAILFFFFFGDHDVILLGGT